MEPKRILLDADPGIDDSLAILLAVASPEVELEAITVVSGNCSARQGAKNALGLLEMVGRSDIPVAIGQEIPLVQPLLLAAETHGNAGLGYAELAAPTTPLAGIHAVDLIIDTIMSNPGEITLVPIGPLTNIAMAVRREPRIVENVKEVLIMGGAINCGGNTTPLAEFNTYCDPHAAHIVFHSGLPQKLIPLDVTYQVILQQTDVDRLLKIKSPVSRFIADSTRFYMEFHDEYQKITGCVINDPVVMALTFAPEIVDYRNLFVDVDISGGISMAKTFADFYEMQKKAPNMEVALEIRPRDFIELFLERMERLCNQFPA
jgi:purine nucleosidase